MASTAAITVSTTRNFTMSSMTTVPKPQNNDTEYQQNNDTVYHTPLLIIYSVVLLIGTISLSLMIHIMKSSTQSTTSIAVLNLIFAHFIFLLTVPFRLYYYATHEWKLEYGWCKMVSSMIHIHMYMSFILYVIILITRLLTFYHKAGQVVFFNRIHAFLVSALLWIVLLVVVPCIIHYRYGYHEEINKNTTHCFKFGKTIQSYKEFNYIVSTLIIVVAITLTGLQAYVLRVLYRRHQGCVSQQEFGAQLKSFCFALIMVICLVPYHIFRLYYVEHIHLENINEVLLSMTTFNCLDMLTFLGRRTCNLCFLGRGI